VSDVYDCTTPQGLTEGVAAAVVAAQAGRVVVLPTDTLYGVGCDAFCAEAVSAVLAAKGRGREMPPPVLVPNPRTVDGLAREVPDYARALIQAHWPGPLTLVLKAQSSLQWDLGDTNGTVAVRMPDDEIALAVLCAVGPMAVTSANASSTAADFGALTPSTPRSPGSCCPSSTGCAAACSSSPARTSPAPRCSPRWARRCRTSTPRATRAALLRRLRRGRQGRADRHRAGKALFGADHANVQPHSGRQRQPGRLRRLPQARRDDPRDEPAARRAPHPRHQGVLLSGKWFNAVHYGVDKDTEDIDYDQVEALAKEHRPKVILAGGSAIPRLIDFARFRAIADEVGAIFWVDAAHFIGLVAGKAIPSPVPYADVVSFTTHKVLRGPRSGAIVCKAEHAAAIDKAVFPMMQGGPQMHTDRRQGGQLQGVRDAGIRRVCRAGRRNAARSSRPSLGEHGIRPTTGGTDTHLSLHDLQGVGVTGKDAEARADAAGIVLNKNAIPFDPQPPSIASGHPGRARRA
jgi:tRNA threonylcarbamoyl adenosine modification protein (Sua5/YciO/YrdC/YwlC family)